MDTNDTTAVQLDAATVDAITDQLSEQLTGSVPVAYRVENAAEVADLGRTTLWNAIRSGDLVATRVGARTVILRDDLTAWLRSHRSAA